MNKKSIKQEILNLILYKTKWSETVTEIVCWVDRDRDRTL
jgi:hypothetical protein